MYSSSIAERLVTGHPHWFWRVSSTVGPAPVSGWTIFADTTLIITLEDVLVDVHAGFEPDWPAIDTIPAAATMAIAIAPRTMGVLSAVTPWILYCMSI